MGSIPQFYLSFFHYATFHLLGYISCFETRGGVHVCNLLWHVLPSSNSGTGLVLGQPSQNCTHLRRRCPRHLCTIQGPEVDWSEHSLPCPRALICKFVFLPGLDQVCVLSSQAWHYPEREQNDPCHLFSFLPGIQVSSVPFAIKCHN